MGLNLEVGMLADLKENDEEGFEYHRQALERVNSFLVTRGLPVHHEPLDCVLFTPDELEAQRLLSELDRIASALDIPESLTDSSEELWQASDSPATDGDLWRRYGRESYGCVVLREGCRRAIASGAALVFT